MFYYLFIIIAIICIAFAVKGKKKHVLLVGLFGLLFVPFSTYAICTYTLDLDVRLKIGNILPTYCTYDGEIEYGTEYVNGQFTYYYGTEYSFDDYYWSWIWKDIGDGWSVQLTDKSSTDPVITPLCTYINDIPVTSAASMFYESNSTSIDTSSYDTSHITSMNCMFDLYGHSNITELDVSNFDTSKVTNMEWMFYYIDYLTDLDVSGFDTSNVINMQGLFCGCYTLTSLDLSNFDTSNVTNMSYMFYECYELTYLDLSSFDMSNVTDTDYMFYDCTSLTTVYARTQEDVDKLSASSYLPSGVQFILKT